MYMTAHVRPCSGHKDKLLSRTVGRNWWLASTPNDLNSIILRRAKLQSSAADGGGGGGVNAGRRHQMTALWVGDDWMRIQAVCPRDIRARTTQQASYSERLLVPSARCIIDSARLPYAPHFSIQLPNRLIIRLQFHYRYTAKYCKSKATNPYLTHFKCRPVIWGIFVVPLLCLC